MITDFIANSFQGTVRSVIAKIRRGKVENFTYNMEQSLDSEKGY